MTPRFIFVLAAAFIVAPAPVFVLAAQGQAVLPSKALYYDCSISAGDDPERILDLDISVLPSANATLTPQVNFRDPAKIIYPTTGWVPKGIFVLTSTTPDRRMFIWVGGSTDGTTPKMIANLELGQPVESNGRLDISLVRFRTADDGVSSAKKYSGNCGFQSGEAAYNRYSNGGDR